MERLSFSSLPGWGYDNHQLALESLLKSCQKLNRKRSEGFLHKSGIGGTIGVWQNLCKEALFTSYLDEEGAARSFFEESFYPYKLKGKKEGKGLLTGYYEIVLEGSRKRKGAYKHPLYAVPQELQKGRKYYSREQIEKGALRNRNLELVWLNDPVEAFFLHVQGSGKVMLDDGSIMCVGFAGRNNHDYQSIGQYMIAQGWIDKKEMSADAIRNWLKEHPQQISSVLNKNPSYIFFTEKNNCSGPVGAQGVELTAKRSAAVDPQYVPYGMPMWVNVTIQRERDVNKRVFQKLVVAQDTGSAIKGSARADLFIGTGLEAGRLAGNISDEGDIYLLLPKEE